MQNDTQSSGSKELNLKLSIDDTNMILEALGQMPFIKVHEVIQKIQMQASEQLSSESE